MGNLIVAGGQDLRVFEIREETAPVVAAHDISDGLSGGRGDGSGGGVPLATDEEGEIGEDIGDSFFDNGPLEVCIVSLAKTAGSWPIGEKHK